MDSALAARPFIAPYMKGELVERGIEAYRGGHPTDQTILGNFHLAGRRESDLESSADTLVFFEAADWSTGSRFVGFADGRIQSCKGTEVVAAVRSREGVLAPSKT
ncbi:MAG: hypothetical protein JSS65_10110 [Armatimonadetes bacterium]|nr:hypothetical protein [Armatimonadota bacterium]